MIASLQANILTQNPTNTRDYYHKTVTFEEISCNILTERDSVQNQSNIHHYIECIVAGCQTILYVSSESVRILQSKPEFTT